MVSENPEILVELISKKSHLFKLFDTNYSVNLDPCILYFERVLKCNCAKQKYVHTFLFYLFMTSKVNRD